MSAICLPPLAVLAAGNVRDGLSNSQRWSVPENEETVLTDESPDESHKPLSKKIHDK
jgi:hypothetical protein